MKQLPKNYDHQHREKYWQEYWVENGTYHWRDDLPREQTFVIDTPPPTVSGVLHMGHIFSYTQADFIARYQRMAGKDVFYPIGFDDNGLPTERLVEKIRSVRGSAMPRGDFVALCRDVVRDAEEEFRTLFKSAALSVDWRQEYQTISDDVRKLSQASFIDLLQKGEAYRDFRPTYWDWVDQTAIAAAEIENKEMAGVMNEIVFQLSDVRCQLSEDIVIMTTRPELLGACVAVMYHPCDPNAAKYKDKFAITPLFGVKVPMIADEAVERDKGTGLVMCCTFGDDTDKEWWRKYKLPTIHLLQKDGRLNFTNHESRNTSQAEALQGLKVKQANAKIIELLQAEGKLLKQTPMMHTVKCAERSGTPIEIIPTHQWFIRIADKKEALLAKGAKVNWHPEYMKIRLNQWIEGLKEDWCISRQRFFGVPIPVWYIETGWEDNNIQTEVYVADVNDLPVDPLSKLPSKFLTDQYEIDPDFPNFLLDKSSGKKVRIVPDMDVLDTWATSSISPQINARSIGSASESRIPNPESRYSKLFPADLRPQAHEIIRTWAFYTIAKAHLHANTIPWKNIIISGWCLASDKTKMSKSKGNVVTPVALIEEKGTDAVRYWASTSRLGTDTAFSEDLLKIGRKLVNKLWNASQFAGQIAETRNQKPEILINNTAIQDVAQNVISEAIDLWILSRLNQCINKATRAFDIFEYCDARVAIEDFFWNDFCDNYLELVKARAYGTTTPTLPLQGGRLGGGKSVECGVWSLESQKSALYTVYHCLDAILRLFAPFVPHITEELYSHIFEEKYAKLGSIHARGNWPVASDYPYNATSEKNGMVAVEVLNIIRKAKSEAGVSIKFPVEEVQLAAVAGVTWENITPILADLKSAGNAGSIIQAQDSSLPYLSEQGWFRIAVKLAAEKGDNAA